MGCNATVWFPSPHIERSFKMDNKEPTADSLKCCGNCLFRRSEHDFDEARSSENCSKGQLALSSCEVCPVWEWDNMTEKERMMR